MCFTRFFNLIWLYIVYDWQFPQLEEQSVAGGEPASFRKQLTTTSDGEEEEEEVLEFYDLSALYRLFKSLYSHIHRA